MVQVNQKEQADVLIVNTCSVREKAEHSAESAVGTWRALKKNNPQMLFAVGGCVASQEGEAIFKRDLGVDVIFGPQTLHRLPELLKSAWMTRKPQIDITFPGIEKFDQLPKPQAKGPVAYVSIMEGCNKYCSYCIVPYTRGEELSRPFEDVMREIIELTQQGVKEITLLGQNVNDYQSYRDNGQLIDLASLLEYLNAVPSLERIRFMTSHPAAFSDRLIQSYAYLDKLSKALHLPVQSGSDKVLALMKRGYTAERYIKQIEALRKACPGDIAVSSDFIVGFPGETEEDFEQTLSLVRRTQMDQSYAFIYSPRPGTPAARLKDQTSDIEKKDRLHRLQALLKHQADLISQGMLGTMQKVLIHGRSKRHIEEYTGKTDNGRTVNFPMPSHLNCIGDMVWVCITEIKQHTLKGLYQSHA